MNDASAEAIATVERELAEFDALEAAVRDGLLRRRKGPPSGPSIAYTIRLDRHGVAALERRAAAAGVKQTVLARNLIRLGLAAPRGASLAHAVEQLEAAVQELRGLTG